MFRSTPALCLYFAPLLLSVMLLLSACGPEDAKDEQANEMVTGTVEQETDLSDQDDLDEKKFMEGKAPSPYGLGDTVSTFQLMNIDGDSLHLFDYQQENNHGYVLIFTCNHCPYAQAYEERIIQLDKTFKPKGYPVVAINPNDPQIVPEDSYEKMKQRAEQQGFTFPYLLDHAQKIYKQFGATRTPHVFIVERIDQEQGVLRYIGALDDNYENPEEVEQRFAAKAIQALLEGKEVDPAKTKAIGCSIKDESIKEAS